MEAKNKASAEKQFIVNIVAVDIILIVLAAFVSLLLDYDFGVVLFSFGMLVGAVGSYLGGPKPGDPNNPRYGRLRSIFFRKHPIQERVDQISYDVKN